MLSNFYLPYINYERRFSMKYKFKRFLLYLLSTIFVIDLFLFFYEYKTDWWQTYVVTDTLPTSKLSSPIPSHTSSENDTTNVNIPKEEELPHDKLFITVERQEYKTGDLTLIIPKLNLDEPVQNGTDADALRKGPGLYDYAQLPGKGNRNVSIAAHRNHSRNGVISEWFFYYIDTLCDGDYLYLTDNKNIYQYKYEETTIVEDDDWSPIYSQGFSCLTLTSCEPIGVATHRIVVHSRLNQIYSFNSDYAYPENEKIEKKNN